MTTGNELLGELAEQLERELRETGGTRKQSELSTLLRFADGVDTHNPVDLFWDIYESQSKFSTQTERLVLEFLAGLCERHRVPYVLDMADLEIEGFFDGLRTDTQREESESIPIPDKLKDLTVYLHGAAARAFRIKRLEGGVLSEDALDSLFEVERTIERLNRAGFDDPYLEVDALSLSFRLSALAISAKVFVELGRLRNGQGDYAGALSYVAKATETFGYIPFYAVMGGVDNSWPTIRTEQSEPPQHPSLLGHLEEGIGGISPQEVASMFSSLKGHGRASSWFQVAADCRILGEAEHIFGNDALDHDTGQISELVEDERGERRLWTVFWAAAEAWASAQLSPSDLHELRKAERDRESEDRLVNYFFRRNWSHLPEGARLRLKNADVIWNSRERIGWEAVFNELRVAMEITCQEFIWRPLVTSRGGKDYLEFSRFKIELENERKVPGIFHFTEICEFDCFREFLKRKRLNDMDVRFMTETLPHALRKLRQKRNPADHGTGVLWSRDEVGPYIDLILGIGREGILPRLVVIGRKIRQ